MTCLYSHRKESNKLDIILYVSIRPSFEREKPCKLTNALNYGKPRASPTATSVRAAEWLRYSPTNKKDKERLRQNTSMPIDSEIT